MVHFHPGRRGFILAGGAAFLALDASAQTAPLIPRRLLFAAPERARVTISPDGKLIAFLGPVDGVLNVWLAPIADPAAARPLTRIADRDVLNQLWWPHDNRHVVFFREQGGDENWQAHRIDITPTKFACAIDVFGISNLVTFANAIPPYWGSWSPIWKVRMGDHTTEEGLKFLASRSPLTYVDRIVGPLLIAQGANDVRVTLAESDQIVAEMQRRNIPVTYAYYSDEGHGFRRPENRRSFTAVVEAFLAQHLGGRCEPVGEDFAGSSIEFRAGRGLIPSLG
jgi:hypothetical protein